MGAVRADPAVALHDVSKRYVVHLIAHDTLREAVAHRAWRQGRAHQWALRGVSLAIAAGESVAVVGPNGSGKSTLLRLVAGIERPTLGTVSVSGGVVSILELGVGFSNHLSGLENLEVAAGLLGLDRGDLRRRLPEIAEFSGLGRVLHRPLREYSSGMIARLGFALAFEVPGDVLLVDEVLAVGDEDFRARCLERVGAFRRAGGTLLFASHEPELVTQLADRVVRLRHGLIHDETS